MNAHLEQLVNLSKIDKDIDAFEPQIEAINAKVTQISSEREKLEAIALNLKADIEESELKKRKNELHLAELADKLEENSKKTAEVKNEREMKSLQLEEEIAKEQITFANEEIERLDKVIENRNAEIASDAEKLAELVEAEKAMQESVKSEIDAVEKERQTVFSEKQKLVSSMNQKGLAFYEKIRRWAKNTTAVPVKKQACYGCFIKLSDKVYADVIKGEEIITCPHCGRLLYIEPESDAPAA
jgi:predicted  nucleic acid-binding Zn-ribbon protein